MVLPRAARAVAQVELEVRVAARGLDDLRERLLGERRAAEVRVHDHAGRVQHAAEARSARRARARRAARCREVARIGARADLLARALEHGPRGVDRERVVDAARELVHRREVAQLHQRKGLLPAVQSTRHLRVGLLGPCAACRRSAARSTRARARRASSGSSVTVSELEILRRDHARAAAACRAPSRASGAQNAESKSTTGKCSTLPVWISVSDSNSSSAVPKPPGKTTKPSAGLHEHRLARVEVLERRARCRGTGSRACSCGSSMLKPTLRPPPSWQPRFAASITPGPPPVIDRPAGLAEELRGRARGSYAGEPSRDARRAEDRDRGPVDPLDRLEPLVELLGDARGVLAQLASVLVCGWSRSSPVVHHSAAVRAASRACRSRAARRARGRARRSRARACGRARTPAPGRRPRTGSPACATPRARRGASARRRGSRSGCMLNALSRNAMFASTTSSVEPRAEPIAHTTAAAAPPKSGPASEMSAFRHGVSPARSIVTYAPMNGMNVGHDTFEALAPRLDDVAELVHEDHQHEAERERPAVEPERVRGDGDEEAEELDEDEAELERGAADREREPAGALERAAQAAASGESAARRGTRPSGALARSIPRRRRRPPSSRAGSSP